jgi:hypothetical protein
MATAIGSCLLPAVRIGWEHLFGTQLGDWAQGTLANLAGAVVLIPTVWVVTLPVKRLITLRIRTTPRPKGNRLAIYVAQFGNDEVSKTARSSVIDSIRKELGPSSAEVLPAGIVLTLAEGVSTDEAADRATARARRLLKKSAVIC